MTSLRQACCVIFGLAILIGCNGAETRDDALPVAMPAPISAEDVVETCAPWLPAEVDGVVVVDVQRALEHHMVTIFGMIPPDWDTGPMMADLRKLSLERLGFDLTVARWALFTGDGDDMIAVFGGNFGEPQTPTRGVVAGVSVYTPVEPEVALLSPEGAQGVVVLTQAPSVERVANVIAGKSAALATSERLQRFLRLADHVGDGDLVAVGVTESMEEETKGVVPLGLAEDATGFGFSAGSDNVVLTFQGPPEKLEEKEIALAESLEEMRQELKDKMANLNAEDLPTAFGTIYAYHALSPLIRIAQPERKDDLLTYAVPTRTATHPVVVIGGAVAILFWGIGQAFGAGLEDASGGGDPLAFTPTLSDEQLAAVASGTGCRLVEQPSPPGHVSTIVTLDCAGVATDLTKLAVRASEKIWPGGQGVYGTACLRSDTAWLYFNRDGNRLWHYNRTTKNAGSGSPSPIAAIDARTIEARLEKAGYTFERVEADVREGITSWTVEDNGRKVVIDFTAYEPSLVSRYLTFDRVHVDDTSIVALTQFVRGDDELLDRVENTVLGR